MGIFFYISEIWNEWKRVVERCSFCFKLYQSMGLWSSYGFELPGQVGKRIRYICSQSTCFPCNKIKWNTMHWGGKKRAWQVFFFFVWKSSLLSDQIALCGESPHKSSIFSSTRIQQPAFFVCLFFLNIYFCFCRVTYRRSLVANLLYIIFLDYICFAVRKGSMG